MRTISPTTHFLPPMDTNLSSSYSIKCYSSKYCEINCIQPAKVRHAMPINRFLFLGQNTSAPTWAYFLCSCGGPCSRFRSLWAWMAKLLWLSCTRKEAEGEARRAYSTGWNCPSVLTVCYRTVAAPAELQTAATLFPGWVSVWVMWFFFNQAGYWIQETIGTRPSWLPRQEVVCG